MNQREIVSLMAVIKTAYPEYYRDQEYVEDAARLWHEMFKDDDAVIIGKAVKEFIRTDNKGFPPKIGQITTIARDIGMAEWMRRQNASLLLEEKVEAVPMPDDLRAKMARMFKRF